MTISHSTLIQQRSFWGYVLYKFEASDQILIIVVCDSFWIYILFKPNSSSAQEHVSFGLFENRLLIHIFEYKVDNLRHDHMLIRLIAYVLK